MLIKQTQSGWCKHTHEQTFISWPLVNPTYKHWDQRQRQINAASSFCPSLLHLLDFTSCICLVILRVISAQTHSSYCNSSPDQACISLSTTREEGEANAVRCLVTLERWSSKLHCNFFPSPHWPSSKVRKSMLVGWGLGFPVDNIRRSKVKRSTQEYISVTTELEKMIGNKKWIREGVKNHNPALFGVIGLIDPCAGIACRRPSLPPVLIEDWRVKKKRSIFHLHNFRVQNSRAFAQLRYLTDVQGRAAKLWRNVFLSYN